MTRPKLHERAWSLYQRINSPKMVSKVLGTTLYDTYLMLTQADYAQDPEWYRILSRGDDNPNDLRRAILSYHNAGMAVNHICILVDRSYGKVYRTINPPH